MRWTRELIDAYIENYHELKNYSMMPWQVVDTIGGVPAVRGQRTFESPFESQAIMNAEFDMAIKKLGELGELTFRLYCLRHDPRVARQQCRRNVKNQLTQILLDSEKTPRKVGNADDRLKPIKNITYSQPPTQPI